VNRYSLMVLFLFPRTFSRAPLLLPFLALIQRVKSAAGKHCLVEELPENEWKFPIDTSLCEGGYGQGSESRRKAGNVSGAHKRSKDGNLQKKRLSTEIKGGGGKA